MPWAFLILWALALLPSGLPEPLHPVEPAAPAVSMVQVRANAVEAKARRARKTEGLRPWEQYRYVTCSHHKAGVDLWGWLTKKVFEGLGLNMTQDFGCWNFECDGLAKIVCYNREAPVRSEMDCCSLDSVQNEQAAYPWQPMRVANTVRDPLDMVASAYCYHHRGMEWYYPVYGGVEVMNMGLHEGVRFMAQKMLDVAANMTSLHENPHVETHALRFEIMSATSAGFDAEVEKLIDFWPHGSPKLEEGDSMWLFDQGMQCCVGQ